LKNKICPVYWGSAQIIRESNNMNFYTNIVDLFGRTKINHWKKFLEKSQYWDRSKQIEYQNSQLKKLITHAYQNVPYYKKLLTRLNIYPYDISNIDDLKKLPVLTKELIRQNFTELRATNYKKFKPQLRKTGGTTGVPLRYYSDQNSWSMHWALKYRAWEWGGYSLGCAIGIMGGASIIPNQRVSWKHKIWNRLNVFYPLPSSHVNEKYLQDYFTLLKSRKIKFLRGYPSSIANFAHFCLNNKLNLSLNCIITTAEILREEYKEIIYKAFDCKIIDTYGCADGGGNANTCSHDNGFHISFEAGIWEVCDELGGSIPQGELGEITLTSLTNYAMPLIRYQPGDLIENSFSNDICSCGRSLPRIKRIFGRSTDILRFGNGKSLGGPAFTLLFRHFPLQKYQLVQNDFFTLDVNIVPSEGFKIQHERRIRELMTHHCGEDIKIIINIMDNIPLPKSGKHRFIINNTQ